MLSDPIADLLTRITNARLAKHRELSLPYSRIKAELSQLLVKKGYLTEATPVNNNGRQVLVLKGLHFSRAKRLSKPGMRLYAGCRDLPQYLRGRGTVVLSTPKGLLTAREAAKLKIGGELLCRID